MLGSKFNWFQLWPLSAVTYLRVTNRNKPYCCTKFKHTLRFSEQFWGTCCADDTLVTRQDSYTAFFFMSERRVILLNIWTQYTQSLVEDVGIDIILELIDINIFIPHRFIDLLIFTWKLKVWNHLCSNRFNSMSLFSFIYNLVLYGGKKLKDTWTSYYIHIKIQLHTLLQ